MTDPASLAQNIYPFDARGIGKRFRHAAIFGALDALRPGEAMRCASSTTTIRCRC